MALMSLAASVLLVAPSSMATGAQPKSPPSQAKLQVEVRVDQATAELVDWELVLGGRTLPATEFRRSPRAAVWAGPVEAGHHTLALRVRYRRDMKTITRAAENRPVAFTFVAGGQFTLEKQVPIEVSGGGVTQVAGSLQIVPDRIEDQLVLASTPAPGGSLAAKVKAPPLKEEPAVCDDQCVLQNFARMFGRSRRSGGLR